MCAVELCCHVLMSNAADMSTIISELQWLHGDDLFALSWQNGMSALRVKMLFKLVHFVFMFYHPVLVGFC